MNKRNAASTARYQALLQLLRTADTVWNSSRVFFARWDISPSQFNVLNLLRGEPRGLSQIEVGRQLIMHRSNVTGLIDRLEKRGLVRREDAANDRRAYRLVLTAQGRGLMNRIIPHYYAMAESIWVGFSASRARELASALKQLSRRADELLKSASDP